METIKSKRARKPNFSSAECTLLLTLAEENLDTIREKFSSSLTNQKKTATVEEYFRQNKCHRRGEKDSRRCKRKMASSAQ